MTKVAALSAYEVVTATTGDETPSVTILRGETVGRDGSRLPARSVAIFGYESVIALRDFLNAAYPPPKGGAT